MIAIIIHKLLLSPFFIKSLTHFIVGVSPFLLLWCRQTDHDNYKQR